VHLAPGFSDAGSYPATVRVSDGSLTDQKNFNITVINVNRPPVANAGGPYSGTVNVPVNMTGAASSDPDGDALTYAWDFGDAQNGTGVTVSHPYTAAGTYTVTLTVTDNGSPSLSNSATTTATITTELPATAFTNETIRLASGKPKACFQIQPVNADYANTDVVLSSLQAKYGTVVINCDPSKTTIDSDKNGDGIQEIHVCFTKADLRILFAGLPAGHNNVTVHIQGTLQNGSAFGGDATVDVVSNGSFSAEMSSVAPNPLNPATKLSFITSKPGTVKIDMFDLQGRLVRTLQGETFMGAGQHEMLIDGRGQSGEKLASGVYFIRGITVDGVFKNTITILK
jgi:PKD repeat protein